MGKSFKSRVHNKMVLKVKDYHSYSVEFSSETRKAYYASKKKFPHPISPFHHFIFAKTFVLIT